ncbi:MAG: lipase [Eubacterium sp.]|nr:lipase [Eubacterium sp.]
MGEQTQAFMKRQQEKAVRNFRILNRTAIKGGVLFTGSSLMEMFPICEMALSAGITIPIYNRGIGGTTTDDFLREIDAVLLGLKPSKVFINIGTNDMNSARYGENWMDRLIKNYEEILRIASEKIPEAEFYLMAYYPANLHLPWQTPESISWMVDRTPENIAECNRRVQALAEKFNMHYIDVNDGLCDENGEQKAEFAMDGVHMYANGYEIVFNNLRPYLQ